MISQILWHGGKLKNIENVILIDFWHMLHKKALKIKTGMDVQQASRLLHPSLILVLHKGGTYPPHPPSFEKRQQQHSMGATGESLTSMKCNETRCLSPLTC